MVNNTYQCPFVDFEKPHSTSYFIVLIISPCAMILNFLTIAAIRYGVKHLNGHYLLVIQQCVTDAIFAFSFIPMNSFDLYWCRDIPEEYRDCWNVTLMNLVNSSICIVIINLIAIAWDHFIAIYKPMKYRIIVTKCRVYGVICFTYVVYVITMATPYLVEYAASENPINSDFCRSVSSSIIFNYHATILFFLSIGIIVPVYVYVFVVACKVRQREQRRCASVNKNYKKALTSLLIIITFKVCFIIDLTLLVVQYVDKASAFIFYTRIVTLILPALNCICDPLIYAIRLPKVRQGYKIMFKCIKDSDVDGRTSSRTISSFYSLKKQSSRKTLSSEIK